MAAEEEEGLCVGVGWGWGAERAAQREPGGSGEGERRGERNTIAVSTVCTSTQFYSVRRSATKRVARAYTDSHCLGLNVLQKYRPTCTTSIVQVSLPS